MKVSNLIVIMILSTFLFSGCVEEDLKDLSPPAPQETVQDNDSRDLSRSAHTPAQRNFGAHLSGDEEVPPVATNATGQAILQFNKEGDKLHYKLIVANIFDVRFSHLHMAPAGENGPVVAFLYPGPTTPGRTQGILAEGYITDADVIGPLAGMGLSALRDRMERGRIYVNVHTVANGPGEIRGQVK